MGLFATIADASCAGQLARLVRRQCAAAKSSVSMPIQTPRTAMVLAAGLGIRMRPLTDSRPKPLIEVGGKTLLDHMLDRLAEAGVETAVVNVHYLAEQIERHVAKRPRPRIVISDERAQLLGTGGAVVKA